MKTSKLILMSAAALMLSLPLVARADAPINTNGAGIYNQMNRQQIMDVEREKIMSEPLNKNEDYMDDTYIMDVEKDYY